MHDRPSTLHQCGLYCFYHYSYSLFVGVKYIRCGAVGGAGDAKRGPDLLPPDTAFYLFVCYCVCTQWYLTLYDPTDCSRQAPLFMGFSRQEPWSGLPCLPPGVRTQVSWHLQLWWADSFPLCCLKTPLFYLVIFIFGCTAWLVGS